jgi:hypothetical protein
MENGFRVYVVALVAVMTIVTLALSLGSVSATKTTTSRHKLTDKQLSSIWGNVTCECKGNNHRFCGNQSDSANEPCSKDSHCGPVTWFYQCEEPFVVGARCDGATIDPDCDETAKQHKCGERADCLAGDIQCIDHACRVVTTTACVHVPTVVCGNHYQCQ